MASGAYECSTLRRWFAELSGAVVSAGISGEWDSMFLVLGKSSKVLVPLFPHEHTGSNMV